MEPPVSTAKEAVDAVAAAAGWTVRPGCPAVYYHPPVGRRYVGVYYGIRDQIISASTDRRNILGRDKRGQVIAEIERVAAQQGTLNCDPHVPADQCDRCNPRNGGTP